MDFALVNADSKVANVVVADDASEFQSTYLAVQLNPFERCDVGQQFDANADPRFFGDVPRPPQSWTAYEFLLRFTAAERAAFRAAAITDPHVADFQQLAQAAQEVVSDDPMTVAGMDYAISVGIVTAERKTEILS